MSEQEQPEQTPFFTVPVVPLCIDADLRALSPDTKVCIRTLSCADFGSGVTNAADAIAEIQRTMGRQAKGNFTMAEAADVLAAAYELDASGFLKNRMHHAARTGALALVDPKDGGPLMGRDCMELHDWVTPTNLDAWLERAGFPFRWPLKATSQAAPPAPVADSASNAPTKKWTPEKLAELKAFRASHTMPETAKKFGISEQRIRELLPSNKPKSKGYSAFTHRPK